MLFPKCPICKKNMIWWKQKIKEYEFEIRGTKNFKLEKIKCHKECFKKIWSEVKEEIKEGEIK